ncbi:helix-turn-helix domain-containing protein [Clostridium butyricum]|uniref:helix-turn-helix domain-containing protein n=1 Tax=Clostridium butyricum TaxID=1492 RepID=UPI0022E5A36D|nr:helix-turn-helix transcriptional regulator [Clostridium butyricum]
MGTNIRNIRKELNLTQKEFAEKLGISRSNLSDIENGRNKGHNTDIILKVSKISGRSVNEILNSANNNLCLCGRSIEDNWNYCPSCGEKLINVNTGY